MYVLVYLKKGELPWESVKEKDEKEMLLKIHKKKK